MFRTSLLAAVGLALAATAPAQTPEEIAKIVEQGRDKSKVMVILKGLTDIGPRLTSSPNLLRAEQWAMRKFREFGCDDVRLEEWGETPVGFERGPSWGKMILPFESDCVMTTMNWTQGTNGPVRGKVVLAPVNPESIGDPKAFEGAWILMRNRSTMRGPVLDEAGQKLRTALLACKPAGFVYGAQDERVHSSGRFTDKSFDKRPEGVDIVVRKSDFDRFERNVRFGRETIAEFNADNRWFKGPVKQFNVIADIKGTEKPDEMIIVCGHIDSWNSPGSQGACDNGTGTSVALEAARIIKASGVKPKRTIRFILWGGEEQGLLGSRAYVEKHKDELDKISAVLNDDGGTNYQGGYVGIEAMRPIMEAAFAPTVAAFPNMPMQFNVVASMPQGGSSDHAPFNWAGVPAFFTIETGRADYGFVWHTQNDRYDAAIPEYLRQSATNHALVSFALAQAPTLLPRDKKPAPRTTPASLFISESAVGHDHVFEDPSRPHDHDHEDDWTIYLRYVLTRQYQEFVRSVRSR